MVRPDCKAIRVNDEYHCVECALRWEDTDDEPPVCHPDKLAQNTVEGVKKLSYRDDPDTYKRYG